MKATLFILGCLLAGPALAQTITGGTCGASNLIGRYSLSLSGRSISAAGSYAGGFQGLGTVTFDGQGNVILSGTYNTNSATGQKFTYSGTYTLPSNCYGTVTLTTGSTATFALVVWSSGTQFELAGSDATYAYSGSGSDVYPVCATPTLSGLYTYDSTGTTLSGTAATGLADESGVLQFDGQGNVTASYAISSSGTAATSVTSSGTYTVTPATCQASATLKDSSGNTNSVNFVIEGDYGQNLIVLEANQQFIRLGTAHSAFFYSASTPAGNPAQSIVNAASLAVNATPPGSVLSIFGLNLATKTAQPSSVPLPDTLLNTSVTVNGESAPLFFVDTTQINAQMPWDIPGNTVATVIVKNTGSNGSTSNAAAVYVPANATPGISVYSNNRAVVVNSDNVTVNSASTPAAVGDEVVVYFTGGGPVQPGKLVTGAVDPAGLQVTGANPTITVGGVQATIDYIGLTAGGIGLYQANFVVPQLAKGTYPVVMTIAGQASNTLGGPYPNPVMTVSN